MYAITRRGYGASSKPERGYSVPELAEDDWRVIPAIKVTKPVVVGHSMAGSELSFLGQKHSPELGALAYFDANADPMDFPWSNAEFRELTMKSMKGTPGPPQATPADKSSIEAYRAFQKRIGEFPFPEGEIRNMHEINPDGSLGKYRTPAFVSRGIDNGSIRKARENEILFEFIHRWEANLKHAVPAAQIVELPGAHYCLFQNEQTDVLREMRAFLQTLDSPVQRSSMLLK